MKISYKWLSELTGVTWPVDEMAERLTSCGTACEDIEPTDKYFDRVVVGEVIDLQPIKGADKIRLATVNIGSETFDLVCGAPNVAVGQKVPVATLGAKLAGGLEIKKAKIRGVESSGMICSERELGMSDDHAGIMVLDAAATLGQPLADHLDYHDNIMDFELTPNRADSMSAIGIARDIAALAPAKVTYPTYQLKTTSEKANDVLTVTSEDIEACPRFTARIIRNITVGPSPWWVQKKLLTAGMRPVSNVVDITNLIMLETGNPLHAFDLDRFGSDEVVVRRARQGEKLTTLDGQEHELTSEVLLITNGQQAKAAAGVMGGFDSEVTADTKNILLEVAYFEPTVIRKSRRQLQLQSEASIRFEKGVDPNNVAVASARAAFLFQELCGGEVSEGLVDFYPQPIEPLTINLRPKRCNELLGTTIATERMVTILEHLEFKVEGTDPLVVTVPTFRPDITREVDLIEEVARIEGYDAIPDAIENIGPLFAPQNIAELFEGEIRTVLTGSGFDEILGHGLADSKTAELLSPGQPQMKIINPVSEDLDIMRNDLILTGLNVVNHNIAHRNLDLKLFEIGKVYPPPVKNDQWIEEDRLLMIVTGNTRRSWREKPRPADFYDLTQGLDALAAHFGLSRFEFDSLESPVLDPEQSFVLKLGGHGVGSIGLVRAKIAKRFDIKQAVYLVQLQLKPIFELSRKLVQFQPLPVYPAAKRDLAMVVAESVRVGEIISAIENEAGELAERVELFDLYTGSQIGAGRKSVAVAISYRSRERSLSSGEVEKLQKKIVSHLEKNFNAEIRDW